MRCVFSETLNGSTLGISGGAPPGRNPGSISGGPPGRVREWRAVSLVLHSSRRALHTAGRGLLDDLVTTFFPAECRACDGPLLRAGVTPVCDLCLARITPQTMLVCACCGESLGIDNVRFSSQFHAEEASRCTFCRLAPPMFERAVAYEVYQDELRTMVRLLKYERMRSVAGDLGGHLATAIRTLQLEGDVTLIAVPLFPAKERQRGYNQAVLLADAAVRSLGKQNGLQLRAEHGALRRTRDTESQYGLTPRARRLNLRGAFVAADVTALTGRTVLLIDDIYTTGATARECARILRRAGAERVFVATLARAQSERVAMWDGA